MSGCSWSRHCRGASSTRDFVACTAHTRLCVRLALVATREYGTHRTFCARLLPPPHARTRQVRHGVPLPRRLRWSSKRRHRRGNSSADWDYHSSCSRGQLGGFPRQGEEEGSVTKEVDCVPAVLASQEFWCTSMSAALMAVIVGSFLLTADFWNRTGTSGFSSLSLKKLPAECCVGPLS